MFKNKNKKIGLPASGVGTKIVCGALTALLLLFHSSIVPVVYAEGEVKPPAATCPADKGWTELEKDGYKCQKIGEPAASCSELGADYHIVNYQTITAEEADEANPVKTTCAKTPKGAIDTSGLLKNIEVLAGLQTFLNSLIWPVLVLIGGLMENDLLFGSGMEERLRDIWIPIRNLVNILFVIVLVGIALYNVLGISEEGGTYSIKAVLPKLVIGIIAINFSFIGIKVFLDAINVLTTSIFALPGQINEELAKVLDKPEEAENKELITRMCASMEGTKFADLNDQTDQLAQQQQEAIIYHQVASTKTYTTDAKIVSDDSVQQIKDKIHLKGQATEDAFNKDIQKAKESKFCTGKGLTSQGELFLKRYNSRNAAFALALNMGKIVFYEDIKFDVDKIEKLFVNTLFSLMLYFVYIASFLALFVVLLGRIVVMWLSIAISPILLLMIAAPTLKEKMGGFSKLSEQFVKNAIAPVLIALSMTIGWIMLKAVQGLNMGGSGSTFSTDSAFPMDPSGGVPVVGLNTLQDFMVALGVIAVVWLGVFSSAEGTIAEFATNWMKEHLLTAGKWIGSLPFKHLPIVPISLPGHEGESYTFSQVGRALERMTHVDDNKLADRTGAPRSATPDNLRNIHDAPGIYHYLNQAKDLEKEYQRKAIGSWLGDIKNRDAIREMRSNDEALFDDLTKLAGANDDEAKTIVKDIQGRSVVVRATTPPASPAAGDQGKKTAAGKPAAPKPLDKTTPVGNTTLGEALGKESTGIDSTPEEVTAKITAVNTAKNNITATLASKKPDADKKTALTTALQSIRKTFNEKSGHPLTLDGLKSILTEKRYGEVEKLVTPGEINDILAGKPLAAPAPAAVAPTDEPPPEPAPPGGP